MSRNHTAGKSPIVLFIKGSAVGILFSAALICLFALILTKKDIPVTVLPYVLFCIGGIGAFISAFSAARNRNMRGVVSGLIAALTFTMIFLPLTFLMSGFAAGTYLLLMPIIHLVCGCLGGIVSRNIKR